MSVVDPAPEADWEVWYQDTFDRDCPRSVEASGTGLLKGLTELWARHLFESVRPGGFRGFSRFNLYWKQNKQSVEVKGDWEGLVHLRQWVFGRKSTLLSNYVREGDRELLRLLALAHCKLVMQGKTGETIPENAVSSLDREDFEKRLKALSQ